METTVALAAEHGGSRKLEPEIRGQLTYFSLSLGNLEIDDFRLSIYDCPCFRRDDNIIYLRNQR